MGFAVTLPRLRVIIVDLLSCRALIRILYERLLLRSIRAEIV